MPVASDGSGTREACGVCAPRINDIVRERRSVTADTALRLAAFFGTSTEFWMGLQADHDMAVARAVAADALAYAADREHKVYSLAV